ncbi:hypothetical protein G7043_31250 [Lentzea sp. NEAU-D13]|uniref:Uncharacterized protein n=1 Tax=Lentzea alba TaxID=2714351 RepID=A0A7C9RUU5_9PSEU|nr:hypothetical protein [Lentzea alba]NGY63409.1 hypothetical protein [Lentzea alba]
MGAAEWIAVAAALIAAGSMIAAFRQAREARESRHAAQAGAAAARDQAEIAEASVAQARRSAEAAEASAAETRRANDFALEKDGRERAERFTERHERDQPRFSLTATERTHVRVTMSEGPPEGVHVRVESVAIVTQAGQSLQVPISLAIDPNMYTFVRNATRDFAVDMRAEKGAAQARLVLLSEEIEGKRSWRWIEDVEFPAPPATSSVHTAQVDHQPPRGLFR